MPLLSPWGYLRASRGPAGAAEKVGLPGTLPLNAPPRQGSGVELMGKSQGTDKSTTTETHAVWPDEEQMLAIADSIGKIPEIDAQKRGQSALENLIGMQAQAAQGNAQLDLSPLADLTSFVTGGKYKSTYKAPENSAQARDKIASYANMLADNRRDIAKTILEGASKFKAGTATEQKMSDLVNTLQATLGKYQKPSTGNPAVNVDRFYKTYVAQIKNENDIINGARAAIAAMKSPNWLGDQNIQSALVEAARLKPVSDRDVKQYGGDPAWVPSINRVIEKATSGRKFSEADRADIETFVRHAARVAETTAKAKHDEYIRGVGSQPGYGYDYSTGANILKSALPSLDKGLNETKKKSLMDEFKEYKAGQKKGGK